MNVVYGQDGEGDDHEGEVHLAVLADVAQHFHVGVDSRATRALASTDPRRAQLGTPTGTLIAGPLAAFTYGPIAVMTEVGMSEVWVAQPEVGRGGDGRPGRGVLGARLAPPVLFLARRRLLRSGLAG